MKKKQVEGERLEVSSALADGSSTDGASPPPTSNLPPSPPPPPSADPDELLGETALPAEPEAEAGAALRRLDIDDVTFEDIKKVGIETLRRICRDNAVDAIGTQVDLFTRLRRLKMGRANRTNETRCPSCNGEGRRLSGPRMTSHTVVRAFKCTSCRQTFYSRQDTRKPV